MKEVYLRNKKGEYLSLMDRKTVVTHKKPYPLQTLPEEGRLAEDDEGMLEQALCHLPCSYLIFKGDGAAICRALYDAEGNKAHITVQTKNDKGPVSGQLSFTTRVDKYGMENQFEAMCYWVNDLSEHRQKK